MAGARPWMPLYIADYLADTAHLNAAQSGAYLHLIMHYWQTGGLPGDDAALCRIARMTAAEWRRSRDTLQAFFRDGWKHKRIDAELAHAAQVSSKRRAAAEQRHSNSSANAEQKETHARTCASASPSPSQSQVSKPKKVSRRGEPLPTDWKPDRDFARSKGFGERQIDEQEQRFRDHAAANRRLQADWDAAWRNWITSPYQRPMNGARAPPASENTFSAIIRDNWEREHGQPDDEFDPGPGPTLFGS